MEEFKEILPLEVQLRIDSLSAQVPNETDQQSDKPGTMEGDVILVMSEAEDPGSVSDEASKNSPAASSTEAEGPPPPKRRSRRNKTSQSEYNRMECNLCLFETVDGREALQVTCV